MVYNGRTGRNIIALLFYVIKYWQLSEGIGFFCIFAIHTLIEIVQFQIVSDHVKITDMFYLYFSFSNNVSYVSVAMLCQPDPFQD